MEKKKLNVLKTIMAFLLALGVLCSNIGNFSAYAAVQYDNESEGPRWPFGSPYNKKQGHWPDWPRYYGGNGLPNHQGTDFRNIPEGTPIYSAYSGTVHYVGDMGKSGYGKYVVVKSKIGGKWRYIYYAHMSTISDSVIKGKKEYSIDVKAGQQIGKLGNTGNSTGPHLHYEVRDSGNEKNINPYDYLPVSDYAVFYKANSGSGAPAPQLKTKGKTLKLSSTVPTKKGYKFRGWGTSARATDVSFSPGADYKADAYITLHALWEANTYYVKFNANGGTAGSMANQTFRYDKTQALKANAFKRDPNHRFEGWSDTAGGKVKYKNEQSMPNLTDKNGATENLYAVWKIKTYSVKFNKNGGTSGSMANQVFNFGSAKKALKTNAFKRDGYTFQGWATTAGGKVKYKNEQSVSGLSSKDGGVVNLYAVWKANTYTVKFNRNAKSGIIGITPDQKFTYDKAQALRGNGYLRYGYKFQGWALTPNGDVKYKNKQSVQNLKSTKNGVITLYAVWKK